VVRRLGSHFFLLLGIGLSLVLAAGAQNGAQSAWGAKNEANTHIKFRTSFVVYDLVTKTTKTVYSADGIWECPSWTRDGKFLVANWSGSLYRIPIDGDKTGAAQRIALSYPMQATNDHALSYDGKFLAVSGFLTPENAGPGGHLWKVGRHGEATSTADLFIANLDGSGARRLLVGWLHGWSPDGKYVVFVANRKGDFDLYRVNVDGTGKKALTTSKAEDDGPETTADGNWIYFCSDRSGKWAVWRMPAEGAGDGDRLAEMVASGDAQDWFPHVSPDGKWLYAISYPADLPGHLYIGPDMKIELWPLPDGPGGKVGERQVVSTFHGGQGAGNTSGWAPDSKRIVWSVYEKLPDEAAK